MDYRILLSPTHAPTGIRVVPEAPAVTLEVISPAFVHRYVLTPDEAQTLRDAITQALDAPQASPIAP